MIKGILAREKLIFPSQKDDNTLYSLTKPKKNLFFKVKIKITFPEFNNFYIKRYSATDER